MCWYVAFTVAKQYPANPSITGSKSLPIKSSSNNNSAPRCGIPARMIRKIVNGIILSALSIYDFPVR